MAYNLNNTIYGGFQPAGAQKQLVKYPDSGGPIVGTQAPAAPLVNPFTPPTPVSTTPGTGFQESFQDFQSRLALTKPSIVAPALTATQFEGYRPTAVTGRQKPSFELERESAKERLRNEFFGAGGQSEQALSKESAAGRLGSGVGGRIIRDTVASPFIEQAAQIDRDVFQSQLDEGARVEELNVKLQSDFNNTMSNLLAKDSGNILAASQANAELMSGYDELASKLANARSQSDIDLLESSLRNQELALEYAKANREAVDRGRELDLEELKFTDPRYK